MNLPTPSNDNHKPTRLLSFAELATTRGITFSRRHLKRLEDEKKFPLAGCAWRKQNRVAGSRDRRMASGEAGRTVCGLSHHPFNERSESVQGFSFFFQVQRLVVGTCHTRPVAADMIQNRFNDMRQNAFVTHTGRTSAAVVVQHPRLFNSGFKVQFCFCFRIARERRGKITTKNVSAAFHIYRVQDGHCSVRQRHDMWQIRS